MNSHKLDGSSRLARAFRKRLFARHTRYAQRLASGEVYALTVDEATDMVRKAQQSGLILSFTQVLASGVTIGAWCHSAWTGVRNHSTSLRCPLKGITSMLRLKSVHDPRRYSDYGRFQPTSGLGLTSDFDAMPKC